MAQKNEDPSALRLTLEKILNELSVFHTVLNDLIIDYYTPDYLWLALDTGSYNRVWKSNFSTPETLLNDSSYQGPWVLKYPIPSQTRNPITDAMNNIDRGIRIWNEINPNLPKAGRHKLGWIAPYLENTRPSTDDEIIKKLVEIYRDTRRIICDAPTTGNFLTNITSGEVNCVDVDLALKRSTSTASKDYGFQLDKKLRPYFKREQSHFKVIEIIQNLLYLDEQLDSYSIDILCEDNKVTVKTIESLTWLRKNNIRLRRTLMEQIATLTEADVEIGDTIFEALTYDESPFYSGF